MILNIQILLINLPRSIKRISVFLLDGLICAFSLWLSLYLRLGEFVYLNTQYHIALVAALFISMPIYMYSGLYRSVFRFSGLNAMLTVAKATTLYAVIYITIFTIFGYENIPRTVGIIQPIIQFILVGTSRAIAYYWLGEEYRKRVSDKFRERVLIYGAGSAGRQLAAALANQREMSVKGYLDDNKALIGQVLNGLTIYNPNNLKELVKKLDISTVLLAIPSLNRRRRSEIINNISNYGIAIRTLPSVSDLAQGNISVNDIADLDIDDLLGRQTVDPFPDLMSKTIQSKKILITGAGGSIGGELCKQIIKQNPSQIILLDQSEYALYLIHQELIALKTKLALDKCELHAVIGSIRDIKLIDDIFSKYQPETVFHAAAYKHVPLVEQNIEEGIKNNIFGTKVIVEASLKNKVANFILISTDKAVRPTNIMGATKRIAELIVQAHAKDNDKTCLSIVRFGNVLGSSGSVVPKFKDQIRNGGPVTVTHRDVTRFFMTIPEAAQLVIQSASMAIGGEVFLLDMGEPIKIYDLAKRMIELSGLSVSNEDYDDGDIKISYIGLRPGEKLYEELLLGNNPKPTRHPRVMKGDEHSISINEIIILLEKIEEYISIHDQQNLRKFLIDFTQK